MAETGKQSGGPSARQWREAAMGLRKHADEWEQIARRIEATEGAQPTALAVERETLIHTDSVLSLIVARYGREIPDDVHRDATLVIGELRRLVAHG